MKGTMKHCGVGKAVYGYVYGENWQTYTGMFYQDPD